MKVLMINGSPHARGTTWTALHEMEKIFLAEGVEVEMLQVGHLPVRGCTARGLPVNCGGHSFFAFFARGE